MLALFFPILECQLFTETCPATLSSIYIPYIALFFFSAVAETWLATYLHGLYLQTYYQVYEVRELLCSLLHHLHLELCLTYQCW